MTLPPSIPRGIGSAVLLSVLLAVGAGESHAAKLPMVRPRPAADAATTAARRARFAPPVLRPQDARVLAERVKRWRGFHDVVSAPGVDWSRNAARRAGWVEPARAARSPHAALGPAAVAVGEPDTIHVAFLRIDFAADRGGSKSSGDGHFDLTPIDTTAIPVDPAPHNRTFYLRHLEALSRYYDVQSYGRTVVVGDVWPHAENGAYTVSDMADFGPWKFSQDIYGAAVHMFRTMMFAADSQAKVLADPIPWRQYDRFVLIHAGSDFQSDLRQDSDEDIPSFTIGVGDSDRIIFPDSTVGCADDPRDSLARYCPIDRASIVPETENQDDFFAAINGVLAHECGHNFFGYFDLYDIESGLPVVGEWSLMDSGNLTGSLVDLNDGSQIFAIGRVPPSIDPWQRFFAGDALYFPEVAYGDTMTLRDGEHHPDMRRVTLSGDEYLILENRHHVPLDSFTVDQDPVTKVVLGPKTPDRFEYDAHTPGSGVLVWHIDDSVIPFEGSLRTNADYGINSNPRRHGIDVIEADALDDLGDPGSPFIVGAPFDPFFLSNNPSLSDSTAPNLIPYTGARPHVRLDFLDDPALTMHLSAAKVWALPDWPVLAQFPPEGPQLLAVDADGDRKLEVCWAGGIVGPSAIGAAGDTTYGDSTAIYAVRPDRTGLLSASYDFYHFDHRPRPLMAAVTLGETPGDGTPGIGPALFAVSTIATGPNPATDGGQVWMIDATGTAVPGWPAAIPTVTTPPVIAGLYPNALVFVGCVDGRVYALGLDGTVKASSDVALAAPISGRLAVESSANASVVGAVESVAAGDTLGNVAVLTLVTRTPNPTLEQRAGWPRRVGEHGFVPDFLWLNFDGAGAPAGRAPTCADGGPSLVVHHADRLWAFCRDGEAVPGWGHANVDTIVAGLAAGDPDGDGFPEVLTQSTHSRLAFWNRSGWPSPGWPKPGTDETFQTNSAPLAVDVDGDGRCELLGLNATGILDAFRLDGHNAPGWPLASGSGVAGAPVAADLDGDGRLELVVPDRYGFLYAYALPVSGGGPVASPWTTVGGDAGRTSALPAARASIAPAAVASGLALERGTLKAYPNPARRHPVSFAYRLSRPAEVEFRILDASGHEVASFRRHGQQADNVEVWDPGALPAGLYLARLRFEGGGESHTETVPVGLIR